MIHGAVEKGVDAYPRLTIFTRLRLNSNFFSELTRVLQPRENISPGSQISMNLVPHNGSDACGVKKRLSPILDLRRQVMTRTMRHTESKFNGTTSNKRPRVEKFVIPTR